MSCVAARDKAVGRLLALQDAFGKWRAEGTEYTDASIMSLRLILWYLGIYISHNIGEKTNVTRPAKNNDVKVKEGPP